MEAWQHSVPDRQFDESALSAADWRGPDGPPVGMPERRRAPRPRDRFHARARRTSFAEERVRAQELVDAAKGLVTATFADIRFGRRIDVAALAPVVSGITASVARNPTALPSVTRLKTAHEYTYLHSIAVCGLMVGLARELDMDAALVPEIGLAGLLHDIGKARVPVELLDKPGPLDVEEYAIVQQHTSRGYDLLRTSGIESPIALDVCLHHHERMDGRGYPKGLDEPGLSTFARMGAVCDVYDAVTSARSYKSRWSPGEALEWMSGTEGHFDPRLLRAFRMMIGIFPVGSLVRLESQRLAVVVDTNGDDPCEPDVCVFLCAESHRAIPRRRIGTRADRIVGTEMPGRWPLGDWDALRGEILRDADAG